MKVFVLGDIHGAYKALLQCLERSGFDKFNDLLIPLGDIADGWSQVPECVEELLSIKNLISLKGNHDDWCQQWLTTGVANPSWLQQGGQATYDAYTKFHPEKMLKHEKEFWSKQAYYYHDKENNRVFVHGGYVSPDGIGHDDFSTYLWDRELWSIAMSAASVTKNIKGSLPRRMRPHKEIFIGHTTTEMWGKTEPMNACNVWNLDTGAGWEGKLTIMDVDSKEYWQSDLMKDLYPCELIKRKAKL